MTIIEEVSTTFVIIILLVITGVSVAIFTDYKREKIAQTLRYYPHCLEKYYPLECAQKENKAKKLIKEAREIRK